MTPAEQLGIIRQGVERIVPEAELLTKLGKGRPLRVKLGVDPTAPDLHLGHTIALTKLRQLQDLGHHAILLIGDFTARIGDPSGRSSTRPELNDADIEANARTYQEQAFEILDRSRCEVVFNSQWFHEFTMDDVIRLCARYTVARLLERDDFGRRFRGGDPIGVHELLYPLLQGYDSVRIAADIELGGTDQTFNILVGRDLQHDEGLEGQVAILLPILEGVDGVQKMSKSLGNAIAILDPPREMFGKLMSISDDLMVRYQGLLSMESNESVGAEHPLEAKKRLASEQVTRFHGKEAAADAQRFFEERHQKRRPVDPEVHQMKADPDGSVWICKLLRDVHFANSSSEARRLVQQGAVRVDGHVIRDANYRFRGGVNRLLQVGRRRLARIDLCENAGG